MQFWLIAVEVAGEGAVEDAFGEGGFGGGSDAAAEAAFGEGLGAECGLGFGLVVVGERGGIGEAEELEAGEAFGAGAAIAGEKRGALIGGEICVDTIVVVMLQLFLVGLRLDRRQIC